MASDFDLSAKKDSFAPRTPSTSVKYKKQVKHMTML